MRHTLLAAALLVALAPAPARAAAPPQDPTLRFLNEVVRWYHAQVSAAQLATDPGDVVLADAVRRQARQVLQLAFAFARGEAALRPAAAQAGGGEGAALASRAQQAGAAVAQAQARVDALRQELGAAPDDGRAILRRQLDEAQAELQLATARRDTLSGMVDFVNQAGLSTGGAAGLLGQIAELERSVPEASAPAPTPAPAPAPPAAAPRPAPGGIAALAGELVSLGRKLSQLSQDETLTRTLQGDAEKERAPLGAELRATLQQADALTQAAPTQDPAALQQRTASLDQITARFKAVSATLAPAGKLGLLLDAHQAVLAQWHAAVDLQWDAAFRTLLLHVALLAAALAILLVASGFWRRATLRYVHDARRRQQSLLVRRIVVGAAIAVMVLVSLVTEVGSLATFAGFITAGLAVALQNVILSVAGYFFLIGRYGIRVGDRVQIGAITGDVMDIGMVRLHLMELGPTGIPTGRVVVFSNAVLFQPTANFFKQIPGSNYAWHEVTLTLAPDTDYRHAEARLLGAVEQVFARYRERIQHQHRAMAENLSLAVKEPGPQSQLRVTQGGVEMTIRFPVPLEAAPGVDDEVARALLDAVEREPRLRLVGSATPTIQGVPQPA